MIVSRIDATQIFFRTGQLSLFEKKTKYFPIFTPPPPPLLWTPTQHINFVLYQVDSWASVPAEKTCHVPCFRRYGRVCSHMSEQYHKQSRGGQQLEIS